MILLLVSAVLEFVPPLATGKTLVTLLVRSIVPADISLLTIKLEDSTPRAALWTTPAVANAGSVIVFAELPIVTPPVEVPVLIFVALFDPAFKFTAPPVIVAPVVPVSNPAEVMAPVPVAEIFPLVVTSSPKLVGESIMPVRLQ